MERALFLNNNRDQLLFADLFLPENNLSNGKGMVICQPFAEERIVNRRIMVNAARYFCHQGYTALLFDYFGEGDSEGYFEQATLETRIADVRSAAQYLMNCQDVSSVDVLGLRTGASVAALAAQQEACIDSIILWQPVVNGADYLNEWLKSNLASQITLYRKVIFPRKQLMENILNGRPVEVDGYIISKVFAEQLLQMDLRSLMFDRAVKTLLVELSAGSTPGILFEQTAQATCRNGAVKTTHIVIKKSFEWTNMRIYKPRPEELFRTTCTWLSGGRMGQNTSIDQGMGWQANYGRSN